MSDPQDLAAAVDAIFTLVGDGEFDDPEEELIRGGPVS
jgi:hypothetical protein